MQGAAGRLACSATRRPPAVTAGVASAGMPAHWALLMDTAPPAVCCCVLLHIPLPPPAGVILFKHHDPLSFNLEQLQDLVNVSHSWFQRAAAADAAGTAALGLPPRTLHPLLVWNCLPRAGASQFHGHAQVLLSDSHFPTLQHELEAVDCYDMSHGTMSRGYYQDLLAAHEEAGLLLREGGDGDFAFAYPSLAPWKVRPCGAVPAALMPCCCWLAGIAWDSQLCLCTACQVAHELTYRPITRLCPCLAPPPLLSGHGGSDPGQQHDQPRLPAPALHHAAGPGG